MRRLIICLLIATSFLFAACASKQEPKSLNEREMTLGLVQKEIHKGMSQADVAEAIGSPNIVTKDSGGKEAWVYDKIATECQYSRKGGYWTLVLFGWSSESGKYSSSQKTLTVVVKFDAKSLVDTVAYHASKF